VADVVVGCGQYCLVVADTIVADMVAPHYLHQWRGVNRVKTRAVKLMHFVNALTC